MPVERISKSQKEYGIHEVEEQKRNRSKNGINTSESCAAVITTMQCNHNNKNLKTQKVNNCGVISVLFFSQQECQLPFFLSFFFFYTCVSANTHLSRLQLCSPEKMLIGSRFCPRTAGHAVSMA